MHSPGLFCDIEALSHAVSDSARGRFISDFVADRRYKEIYSKGVDMLQIKCVTTVCLSCETLTDYYIFRQDIANVIFLDPTNADGLTVQDSKQHPDDF